MVLGQGRQDRADPVGRCTLKGFKDLYLKATALIVLFVPSTHNTIARTPLAVVGGIPHASRIKKGSSQG